MERSAEKINAIVWMMRIYPKKGQSLSSLNREIRNWLGENIGSGSWETELSSGSRGGSYSERRDPLLSHVKVMFDTNAEEDAMAFKLAWL